MRRSETICPVIRMDSFRRNSRGKQIVLDLCKTIQDNAAFLSEVDGAIGDGDHGVNMNKGFAQARAKIGERTVDFSVGLHTLGEVLLTEIGGAMGPLYGTFFIEMARVCNGKADTDKRLFAEMLDAALHGVEEVGNATVGDKTLLDTLAPATALFAAAVQQDRSFREALGQMTTAAEHGKESTCGLVAKVGRASRLGERSRGTLDAGATSCHLILQSLARSISRLLREKDD